MATCPIMSQRTAGQRSDIYYANCIQEQCQWWSDPHKECKLVLTAWSVESLTETLEACAQNIGALLSRMAR